MARTAKNPGERPAAGGALPTTRRGLFAGFGLLSALAVVPLGRAAAAVSAAPREPVIGFHADAPWLDPTGRDLPYRPVSGHRQAFPDAESLARLGHFL